MVSEVNLRTLLKSVKMWQVKMIIHGDNEDNYDDRDQFSYDDDDEGDTVMMMMVVIEMMMMNQIYL